MKAAVLQEFCSELVIQDVTPADPTPDEVLVRVVASGVCHSDRTAQQGANPLPLPLILGHEVGGVVESVGRDVTYVDRGDHVVTNVSASCGRCRWCRRGQVQHCENKHRSRPPGAGPRLSMGGVAVEPFVGLGGFAELLLVHQSAVVKVPPEMPLDRAALLGCAVTTGVGAVRNAANVQPGETVAVIGCGGVGLNAIQGARLCGASRIIAIDRIGSKLDRASLFGATDVVDAGRLDPVTAVRELTGVGVDHAIEVVGLAATMQQAFAMLDVRGQVTMIGVPRPEVRVELPAAEFLIEKRFVGSRVGSGPPRIEVPRLCELYLDGRLMLDELISDRPRLAEVNRALDDLDNPLGARAVLMLD
jgi:S-(hydroxymethyl)glutathione dehydrogenase / alcohol dehydrogenase